MSHLTTLECVFADLAALRRAVARLGWTMKVSNTVEGWRSEKAKEIEYVISMPEVSYQIGLKKKVIPSAATAIDLDEQGRATTVWTPVCDLWGGSVERAAGPNLCKLNEEFYRQVLMGTGEVQSVTRRETEEFVELTVEI